MTEDKDLQAARLAAGKTQADVSGLLDISITTLSQWERGRRKPAPYVRDALIRWYAAGCTMLRHCDDIRAARQRMKLTQADVTHKLGIPIRTMTKWETGAARPAQYVLDLMAWRYVNL